MKYKIVVNPFIVYTFFAAWSFAALCFFHYKSFGPEVRYYQIAEGNISHAVADMWEKKYSAFADSVKSDAHVWGRIRPGHWLYYNIPFALTLVRNGDFFRNIPDVPISQRVNGDLQTHTLFLLFSLALATACISYLLWKYSASIIIPLLFPVYFASTFTICPNLIVYHADSQEIPQILFICFYLLTISAIFQGRPFGWKREVLSAILIIITYSIKETSILLFPTLLVVFLIAYFFQKDIICKYRNVIVRQVGIHSILFTLVIIAVFSFKSGAYVSENYNFGLDMTQRLVSNFVHSWNDLQKWVPLLSMIVVGLFALCFLSIYDKKEYYKLFDYLFLYLLFSGLCLFFGFWMINIPWMHQLNKYFVVSAFFASFVAILLQFYIYKFLYDKGLIFASIVFIYGSIFFMLHNVHHSYGYISQYYTNTYSIRKSIFAISRDIFENIQQNDPIKVFFIDDGQVPDGLLQLQRQVNLIHGINIAVDGKPVNHVRSHERNFFRNDLDSPSVEIWMDSKIKDERLADWIYILDGTVQEDDVKILNSMGYRFSAELSAGPDGPRVLKFIRI